MPRKTHPAIRPQRPWPKSWGLLCPFSVAENFRETPAPNDLVLVVQITVAEKLYAGIS